MYPKSTKVGTPRVPHQDDITELIDAAIMADRAKRGDFSGGGLLAPAVQSLVDAAVEADRADQDAVHNSTFARSADLGFRTKLQSLGVVNLNHLAIGDSICEGAGASAPGKRWVDLLRTTVKAKYQPPYNIGGGGYVPIGGVYPAAQPCDWVLSGIAASVSSNEGFGGSYGRLLAAGNTASLTFTGTGIIVYYTDWPGGGNPTVTIDAVTVAQLRLASNPTKYGNRVVYTGLTNSPHTIVITYGANPISIYGALILNGDETAGWRTFLHARSGTTVPSGDLSRVPWASADPSLVTIYYGTNEYNTNETSALFQTRLSALVDTVRASTRSNPVIVLFMGYQPKHPTTPIEPWANYTGVVASVAAAKGCLTCDLTPSFGTGVISIGSGLIAGDQIHPSDAGYALIVTALMASLGI
jgi:lysophospholipase L1-like esterase